MITPTIQSQIAKALKSKDTLRLSTLRMLSSELHNARIDKRAELNEQEELAVVKREAKKRHDAIEAYEKAARQDLADQEKQELKVLQEFLPPEMSDQDLEKIIAQVISETGASSISDMGRVIGAVMVHTKGQADGARVSALVKQKLS